MSVTPTRCDTVPLILPMKESGGDDPIRTDGASRWHFALAVRRLGPLGHVSSKPLVGMERFELSRAKALASKTSVSPISTTSPRLSNSQQLSYAYSVQVLSTKPVDINRGLPRTYSEEDTAFEGVASTCPTWSPQNRSPSISRRAWPSFRT